MTSHTSLKGATDVFFSLSLSEDAFRAYVSAWNSLPTADLQQKRRMQEHILIYIVRSAVTLTDSGTARSLIEQEVADDGNMGTITNHILLFEVNQRRGDTKTASQHLDSARKAFYNTEKLVGVTTL